MSDLSEARSSHGSAEGKMLAAARVQPCWALRWCSPLERLVSEQYLGSAPYDTAQGDNRNTLSAE